MNTRRAAYGKPGPAFGPGLAGRLNERPENKSPTLGRAFRCLRPSTFKEKTSGRLFYL